MQTGKFTIFDFEKLQDPNKQEKYNKIIDWATTIRNTYMQKKLSDYTHFRKDLLLPDFSSSFYIKRANEIIKNNKDTYLSDYVPIPLKTVNEKILFMTSLVFSDNEKFIEILQRNGIRKEDCINFGEEIKSLGFYDESKTTMILELLMQEYFENLNQIKKHYGINNTGIIINKILEIAYLHPELLHTKEKS